MQWPIAPTTAHELMELPQLPLIKFEIQVPDGVAWIDICDYWGLGATAKKSYVLNFSFNTGGARMTPNPIAGQFSAEIDNPGNIFHPFHPTSGAQGFFRAGRRVRISLGGHFASGDNDWKRIYGFMDEPQFSSKALKVNITGLDYMRRLSDMKFTKQIVGAPPGQLPTPIDNYWGDIRTLSTDASVNVYSAEMYAELDAMEIGAGEANNVTNWQTSPGPPQGPAKGWVAGVLSAFAGEVTLGSTPADNRMLNDNIVNANVTAGRQYRVIFSYQNQTLAGTVDVNIYESGAGGGFMGGVTCPFSAAWATITFFFTATKTGTIRMTIENFIGGFEFDRWRIDEISVMEITGTSNTRYNMDAGCTGIYSVVLNGVEQWPGKQKGEGWYYDNVAKIFYFDDDKQITVGWNNLIIYYFTTQQAQNVLADILVKAYPTVYGAVFPANREAASDAMQNPVTGVGIDRVWFKAGSSYIDAVRMLCERCNYRFYFAFNGTPRFVPAPTPAAAAIFIPFLPKHIDSPVIYQSKSEIWNRIVIEGEKIAELTGWEENMPSELRGEAFDNISMINYGTRTLSIKNHLFQNQASIDAPVTGMCAILLAAYKDPKWYLDLEMPYNAAPMEIGDTIQVEEFLELTLADIVHICLIRNISVSLYDVTYNCEIKMSE